MQTRKGPAGVLLQEVADQLGLDVYYVYPDSRHFIPETVVLAVATACVIEFLKGFFDFNGLGKASREAVLDLARRWRSNQDLEPLIQTLDLQGLASEVLEVSPSSASAADLDKGQASLTQALSEFGMDQNLANEHAQAIRAVMEKALCPKTEPQITNSTPNCSRT